MKLQETLPGIYINPDLTQLEQHAQFLLRQELKSKRVEFPGKKWKIAKNLVVEMEQYLASKPLSLTTWNIEEVKNTIKLDHDLITNSEIILRIEFFSTNELHITNFNTFNRLAIRNPRGRPSGGLNIACTKKLDIVSKVLYSSDNTLSIAFQSPKLIYPFAIFPQIPICIQLLRNLTIS